MHSATATSNAALVRRWFEEVWGQRNLHVVDELLTADSQCHAEQGTITGPEEFKQQLYAPMVSAFPDLRVELDQVLECDEHVVVRWRAQATHCGDSPGFPATGLPVSFAGITWVQLKDGKFGEGWQSSDIPLVVQKLTEAASRGT